MTKNLILGLMVVAAVGCGGAGDPSVSGLAPSRAFLSRTMDVQISGFATKWTDATTVDFGAGITVNKVSAASSTGVIANITIAPTAALGPRDVTVTDGGNKEVFKGAFKIESPIDVTISGDFAQGSVVHLKVDNKDFDNLFDTTAVSTGFFSVSYPNISFKLPTGAAVQDGSLSVGPFSVEADVQIDVMAAPAMTDFELLSGPKGTQLSYLAPAGLNLTARTAGVMAPGDTMVMFPKSGSSLLTFTPGTATTIQEFNLMTDNQNANFNLAFLPSSGKWKDQYSPLKVMGFTDANPVYVVTWDNAVTDPYSVTWTRIETPAMALAEAEPNNSAAGPQTLDPSKFPTVLTGATIASDTDEDWFTFTVSGSAVGKKLRVVTNPGSPFIDTAVDIFGADKTTSILASGGSNGGLSNALTAGAVYVQIAAGQNYSSTDKSYVGVFRLE